MKLLTAPFYSFFSRQFYSEAARAGVGRSFLYLLYLTSLMFVLTLTAVNTRFVPKTNEFVVWLQSEMPVMEWTSAGLSMKDRTAFALVHPEYGPIARFDMTRDQITPADMGQNSVYVTAQKIYMRQPGQAGLRIIDVRQLNDERAEPFQIRPDTIGLFYEKIKGGIILMLSASIWAGLLIWKTLAALFYSWIALLINMTRREKLDYSHLWSVTCFALTPAALIQSLQFVIPQFAIFPFGTAGSFVITAAYLYWAIKGTEPPKPSEPAAAV